LRALATAVRLGLEGDALTFVHGRKARALQGGNVQKDALAAVVRVMKPKPRE
jgi:hypothetical protein